jgi:hypothetical protein
MDQDRADRKDPRLLNDPGGATGRKGSDPELLFWRQFAEAKSPKAFCQSWLPLQCRMLKGVKHAMVLLGNPDQGPFTPVAVWPDAKLSMSHLAGIAEKSIRERRGLLLDKDDGVPPDTDLSQTCKIAYPIEVSEKIHGVVVLETERNSPQEVQGLMRQLHWGAAWLEVLIRRTESAKSGEINERLKNAMDLVVSVVEHEDFHASAMAFVTRLAILLDCDRVSMGFVKKNHVKVGVLSHSTDFGEQTNLAMAIGLAMDEAVDQKAVIQYHSKSEDGSLFTRAHKELEHQFGSGSILTLPLEHNDRTAGALTLERSSDKPFDSRTVELCETVASLITPVLMVKRQEDRLIIRKVADSVILQVKRMLGPGFLVRKVAAIGLVCMAVFFSVFRIDYRVTADSVIEGKVKRVMAAPFNGYIKEAPIRAGDVVRQGQAICLLDDRDLKLERFKWATEREQLLKQYHEAMAKHDRSQIQIIRSKIDQTKAQTDLLDEQLSRIKITAPFDAVVMSGDLSQSLGAPVERGQVLFEVAPLDEYRVIIEVDERDITDIRVGQKSEMIFSSIPGEIFPFVIGQVTPVTTAREGRNYFRVEGWIDRATDRLRPGMEGVGKIRVDRRLLIWVWTHKAVDWLRLKLWRWIP